jgi:uncharacterized protein (DUF1778 family)
MSTSVVFARMKKEDVALLKKICEARGEDISDFIRRAVYKELAALSFLSEAQKKALGVQTDTGKTSGLEHTGERRSFQH